MASDLGQIFVLSRGVCQDKRGFWLDFIGLYGDGSSASLWRKRSDAELLEGENLDYGSLHQCLLTIFLSVVFKQ